MTVISYEQANKFVEVWRAAWNSHDVPELMNLYDEGLIISSPMIREYLDVPMEAFLYGKADYCKFCEKIFENFPNFQIEVLAVAVGVNNFTIHYTGLNEILFAETVEFGQTNMKVLKSIVWY